MVKFVNMNEDNIEYFNKKKERAEKLYNSQKSIYNPYFRDKITFNSDGFHHLQFSARRERNKKEQRLKFSLLPLAITIIKKSGTIQEYRKTFIPIGKKGRDGFTKTKNVEYWAFIAIIGEHQIKIRVIIRKIGDGKIIFWSVMPDSSLKNMQKLYECGIEDE